MQTLRAVLAIGAGLFVVVYLATALYRLSYPYELEWREGGSLQHVLRILEGKSLYVPPNLNFMPFPYPPLYYYASAVVASVLGASLLTLRLVSFVSSLACIGLIVQLVRRETRNTYAGFLAGCLFAAMYRISGGWLDIADGDSLFLALFLAGVYAMRRGTSWRGDLSAGILFSLAFLTRQQALLMFLPVIAYCLSEDRRRGLVVGGSFALVAGLGSILYNTLSGGWYTYYVFRVPAGYSAIADIVGAFWRDDLLTPLLPAVFLAFAWFLAVQPLARHTRAFWLASAIGMVGTSYAARVYAVGWSNDLLPAYAIMAVLFGLGLDALVRFAERLPTPQRLGMQMLVYVVCLVQFAHLFYNPLQLVPRQADVRAGNQLVQLLSQMPGRVYVPFHAYVLELAGKESHSQGMAIQSVLRSDVKGRVDVQEELNTAIRRQQFSAIVADRANWFLPELEQYYQRIGPVFRDTSVFFPPTGFKTRPESVYVPKR